MCKKRACGAVAWLVKVLGSIIAADFFVNTVCFTKLHSTRSQNLVVGLVARRKVARAYTVTGILLGRNDDYIVYLWRWSVPCK